MVDLAKKFEDYGVEAIIYTDIGRDGMLTGVNIEATVKLAQALTMPVIALGRPAQPRRHRGAVRASRPKASTARSPAARSTRARSISRQAQARGATRA